MPEIVSHPLVKASLEKAKRSRNKRRWTPAHRRVNDTWTIAGIAPALPQTSLMLDQAELVINRPSIGVQRKYPFLASIVARPALMAIGGEKYD